jgi:hypothetical protein
VSNVLKYIAFTNKESGEETIKLVSLAKYFNALEHDGTLSRNIPKTSECRPYKPSDGAS